MRLIACLVIAIAAALPFGAAQAQDKPLLVLQLESALNLTVTGRKAGLSGAVYALAPRGDESGVHSVQVAFDARNRPVLTRLVRKITNAPDSDLLVSAAQSVVPLVLPAWQDGPNVLAQQAAEVLRNFASDGTAVRTTIQAHAGQAVTVDFVAAERLAIVDLPVDAQDARRLDESSVSRLISDATLTFEDGATGGHRRYHAPNGRLGGGDGDGETRETGSWMTNADGHYCIETAPVPEFRCFAVYDTGSRYAAVPVIAGAADSRGLRHFRVEFGNPGQFSAPRRNDATGAAVTAMIVSGQTEERRRAGGGTDRIFLKPDGDFAGIRDGQPVQGRWSVMSDGRRCLTDADGINECAFLSETDGGTFRHFDAEGVFLGEALYREGNPNGF